MLLFTHHRSEYKYPRRSRAGHGMISLLVVLFFASIIIQSIATVMVRDNIEAKTYAAFNITREHLDAFEITGNASTEPHLASGSRYLSVNTSGDAGDRKIRFFFTDGDLPSDRDVDGNPVSRLLYEQKLRAFVNMPSGNIRGDIAQSDIRRKHPERLLRQGDRMTTALHTQNITNTADIESGTVSWQNMNVGNLIGTETSLIDTRRMETLNLQADHIHVDTDLTITNMTSNESLSSPSMAISGSLENQNKIEVRDAIINTIIQMGPFIDQGELSRVSNLSFGNINVAGLRAKRIDTDSIRARNVQGLPSRGNVLPPLSGILPPPPTLPPLN